MKLLDKYLEVVKEYYETDSVGAVLNRRGTNLDLEPTRMLLLLVNIEEGWGAMDCYNYFKFTKNKVTIYNDLRVAHKFYETDRAFKRRYNEILKLVKDEGISKGEVV